MLHDEDFQSADKVKSLIKNDGMEGGGGGCRSGRRGVVKISEVTFYSTYFL